ncbi:MAG: alpha/beta hydrolase, partial [Planctomycetes bacterium]|nr:alpha/beta hydrolase [Planctomycetota bacterium]
CPMLYVHGDHDTTVSIENLGLYRDAATRAGRSNREFVEMTELGHFLEDSTRKAFVVKEALVDCLADWLKRLDNQA